MDEVIEQVEQLGEQDRQPLMMKDHTLNGNQAN